MKILISVLICAGACLGSMAAEPPAGVEDPVARELAEIRSSLDRLAGLLEEGRVFQHADLFLRRLERKERRLIPLESRLRSVRENRAQADEELESIASYRVQMEQGLREARDRGEAIDQGSEMIRDQIEAQEKVIAKRKESLDAQIRQLEDDIAEQQEEIEYLEATLEEMLARIPGSD